ncbi:MULTISPECIES: universal stress protein [Ralstonia solanacearum species complex]|uniref:Putative universal stress protein uspa and related nucleotide-binding proteins n=1 Tax=Ralstonia solanacearum TaxID=305 RepID=A0A0S4W7K9_RALSL|nr:universal stress protein [Ralstonia pseudosolanacearum]CUV25261.1 putative universal stress protein uspa and related nucleotide-binding proteins [Ralstonia solanacearum]CUV34781.1 putative universal stress protein uspa and related nucleotide-binding proteins [Ralstonia solanacearum]CUV42795.1 putative universal stress protein uspa and related nucleotide-binding proteins [Ralstonia solanacearum]CUV61595.1 putative universal stress protein uspa and related nucleotide-binding proteins [Ralstoni
MTYASVMVHLDRSERAMHRLELAIRYAQAHHARLIAVYASFAPSPSWFYMMEGAARYIEEDRNRRDGVRDVVHERFRDATNALSLETEWRSVDGDPVALVLREAREADLLIVGQRDPDDPESFVAADFVETLILEAGRPVLVVPYAGRFTTVAQRLLVAWNGGRESARALHDAVPLMHEAIVYVLQMIDDHPHQRAEETTISQVACALLTYGIDSTVEEAHCVGSDVAIGEMLLSRAADFNADLIVTGAYGHSRLRELVLGGVTRTLLNTMTVPVLMSH